MEHTDIRMLKYAERDGGMTDIKMKTEDATCEAQKGKGATVKT